MKRVGNLYNNMISLRNMEKAYAGVMKGKRHKFEPGSIAFMIRMNKDYYMAEVGRMLYERSFKPSKPRVSTRWDEGCQKFREIKAPKLFPDQFVHWAMMLQLQPIFMRGMDDWCCASIKDRGILYAKNFIERKLDNSNTDCKFPVEKKYKYCLKMDIKKFFDNIDREILMQKLERKIKDKEMLNLCRLIIYSVPGKGIPLGYYTSQWFANFYLQDYDHHLRENLMPKYNVDTYVRYMDDMIILGSNKRKLQNLMKDISIYLSDNLKLSLKETSCIFEIAERDIDFIGYRFSYGKTTLRKKIIRRASNANRSLYSGKFTLKKLRRVNSYKGWFDHSDTSQYEDAYLQGSRDYESYRLKEALNKERNEYLRSKPFEHMNMVTDNIIKLRSETQNEDDHVLIRYYKSIDEVRVVARTKFEFPDEKEYKRELELSKQKKQKKKKSNNKNKKYIPTAEIALSDRSKEECIRDYNNEIRLMEELRKCQ